ncbi:lipopolysaccharide biosynthesis protein [Collinsella sp. AGMB00827]|uniref:Lipopolysaccharide biosynthesis protein n=1 Tax=Collinsella ureilytica TaxID=2869515 RepID=A0ABS7MIK8_9ACTN|nr:lipopolysaccharide biosynthesis protein [Collinsella urealyticum]
MINAWWTRLLQSIYHGSLSEQEAEYAEHETSRDYLWNTIGTMIWGFSFPILTIIAVQLAGVEQAGRFSMAFVTGTLLMIAANYGVRTFQVSDLDERASFASYQINRIITSVGAILLGLLYCSLRGYDPAMTSMSLGVYIYKVIDGLADVYEGRLQQADKLYLAGVSQALRSAAAVILFALVLLITRSLMLASAAMALAAAGTLIVVTIPLAFFETEKSRRAELSEVSSLLVQCAPLAAGLFLFNLIETMPKIVMEGALPYDSQLYFNAMFFPAQGILIAVGFIYRPQLLRLASIWGNPRRRRRFDLIVLAMLGLILVITGFMAVVMGSVGVGFLSMVYGLDFERYKDLAILMVCAGGITAAIDFLYAILTVLRRAGDVMRIYLIAFAASFVLPLILIHILGLAGAVMSYLAVMGLLLGLLLVDYVRIRQAITRERNPFSPERNL